MHEEGDNSSTESTTEYVATSLALAQNNQTQDTGNQTQATVELTIVDICFQLDNQSTHTRTNPRSWYQSYHPNDVAPTYRNTVVSQSSWSYAKAFRFQHLAGSSIFYSIWLLPLSAEIEASWMKRNVVAQQRAVTKHCSRSAQEQLSSEATSSVDRPAHRK
ncbi:hypothetical protein F511_21277 [Dorcoceras hygrometricum]|uniref:Uncharacterized protein n=1 Tax=Dorcoceras hygrometricum TaxID=472368 RepID=A0A2Z7C232_9LAMI|nr:hypothetical protein F511_21277 [Dorcoceras hygrometricum]